MNSRTQTPGAHVTNYTHDTAGFLTVASLLSTSHLDWETCGQEKNHTRRISKTPALLGRVLSKTQLGSHAESGDKPDPGREPAPALHCRPAPSSSEAAAIEAPGGLSRKST